MLADPLLAPGADTGFCCAQISVGGALTIIGSTASAIQPSSGSGENV